MPQYMCMSNKRSLGETRIDWIVAFDLFSFRPSYHLRHEARTSTVDLKSLLPDT